MNNVVRNTTTKRKLDWEQEAVMREAKMKGKQRRDERKATGDNRWEVVDNE